MAWLYDFFFYAISTSAFGQRLSLKRSSYISYLLYFLFFTQVWLPFKITLVVPDSHIILLLHQPSGTDLELVGQQKKGRALHQK